MRRLLGWVGMVVWWLAWPFWLIYFKTHNKRSRVLIMCDGEVLLVRGILSSNARWSLPGGGRNRGETAVAAAIRELKEEIGVTVPETALRFIDTYRLKDLGISYMADYFAVELAEKPVITLQAHEILYARWWSLNDIRGRILQKDAAYGLKQYEQLTQERLL